MLKPPLLTMLHLMGFECLGNPTQEDIDDLIDYSSKEQVTMETAILSIGLVSLVILDISFLVYRRLIRADKLFLAEAMRDCYRRACHTLYDDKEALMDEVRSLCTQIQNQEEEIKTLKAKP